MEEHLSHDRFIACHRNQINPKELPKHALTFAYGDWKYDKMAAELHGKDDILRKKDLIEINEDFHRADFVVLSLKAPLLKELIACCKEGDDARRELASSAVMKVASTEEGRQHLIDQDYLKDIAILLRDKLPQIRSNAYYAFLHISEYRAGYEAIVKEKLLQLLVDLLKEEKENHIIVLALTLLKLLSEAEEASEILLKTSVLERLNEHLQSADLQVRSMATLNICTLGFKLEGKKQIILSGSIPIICKLLLETDETLLTNVTKALASLANKKRGKVQIMECGAITRVKTLLKSPNKDIQLNIIQLMANIAEHPKIREELKECLEELKLIQENKFTSEFIKRFAKITSDVITWKP